MRRIHPEPTTDTDAMTLVTSDFRPVPKGRPWVAVNMVTSLDGAVAVDGRSGGLGSPADKSMFSALRQMPDAILVGAGTARAENYGPVRFDDDTRARRVERGQAGLPRLVVVSGRLDLDPSSRLFEDPAQRPVIVTCASAPSGAKERLAPVAEILECGDRRVDLGLAMGELRSMGIELVLCEGGPTLNAQLADADLIDEWCWTIAPLLVAGDSMRAMQGSAPGTATPLRLHRVVQAEDVLLVRYARES